jgi:DNA-binding NtrC family response regulator
VPVPARAPGGVSDPKQDVPDSVQVDGEHPAEREEASRYSFSGSEEREREVIRETLLRCRGNRTRAARELGMARNTLSAKIRRHGLEG